jgi:hypothetical protein
MGKTQIEISKIGLSPKPIRICKKIPREFLYNTFKHFACNPDHYPLSFHKGIYDHATADPDGTLIHFTLPRVPCPAGAADAGFLHAAQD